MKTILFLCTGNVCRSPMAEALFRRAVSGRGDFRVLSAGLGAVDGQPPTPHSVRAMDELGMDISAQRSRMLTVDLVREADLILGMTHGHVDTVVLLYPPAAEKTFLLREFDETLEPYEKDISDPIGGPYPVYVECRDQIEQGIVVAFEIYGTTTYPLPGTPATQTAAVVNFAIGADHGGFEMKEALKQYLLAHGLTVLDFGAKTKDPADDYPDFAQPAAQAVADGRAGLGVLCCTSGVGIMHRRQQSRRRPRRPGRERGRRRSLMRRHNDANVLCLSGHKTSIEAAKKILDAFIAGKFEGGRHERRVLKMDVKLRAGESAFAQCGSRPSPTPLNTSAGASRKTSS